MSRNKKDEEMKRGKKDPENKNNIKSADPISNIEKQLRNKLKKPLSKKEIAHILHFASNEPKFEAILTNLLQTGKIVQLKNNKYGYASSMEMVSGIIEVHPKGFGFLIRDDSKSDIFIPMHLMSTALDKDRVLVKIIKSSRGSREEGKVVSVLERRTQKIMGTLKNKGKFFYVVPDDERILKNIFIDTPNLTENDAEKKVIVTLSDWESPKMNPTGEIVEFVNAKNKVDLMGKTLLIENGFDDTFQKNIEAEAKSAAFDANDISNRRDLRGEMIFTIDPKDAKDFDDAVSIEKAGSGYKIGVHIADVSYFVREGTLLDREAYRRGTSVYLIDKTVPMLPEILSNGLCSLKENEERFTMTCEYTIDGRGMITGYDVFPSVIRSFKRFTYEEAQEMIDSPDNSPLSEKLLMMSRAADLMHKASVEKSRIDFDIPEVEVILSEANEPLLVREKKKLKTHKMIELFMVGANNIVSSHLFKKTKKTLYRSHPEPDIEKLDNLRSSLRSFGYRLKDASAKSIQSLIEKTEHTDNGFVIREMVLRSMMKAKYSTANDGHYGLGLDYYTHFTSPIRRYPDLVIHRQLRSVIEGGYYKTDSLDLIAKHSTEREWAAEKAERDSLDMAKMYYLSRNQKSEYEGVISSVTQFGVFIELKDIFVEGLVRYRDLDDDYYKVSENEVSVTGVHTKNVITLGDRVIVRVEKIEPERKMLDLKITRFLKKQK
ncbi:MAG: ribonuclease R [bacterium]|nr:ribonuclease R [bacterium]